MSNAASHLQGTEKLRELILYICLISEGDEAFGSVKLNKLLFFSDFNAYLEYGQPITGQEYQKLKNGPAPRVMLSLLADMQSRNEIVIADRKYHGLPQKKPLALREPELAQFTAQEIALVDQSLYRFRNMNASEISHESHRFLGWQLAREGETIPYETALLDDRELTQQEKSRAKDLDLSGIAEMLV